MLFESGFGSFTEVAVLLLTFYVIGLALGPMNVATLCEYYGKIPVYLSTFPITDLFFMVTVLVLIEIEFMILRFITGFFLL
jgi:hypothetical protein